jgi:hypothetical protein
MQDSLPHQKPTENTQTSKPQTNAPASRLAKAIQTDGKTDAAYCTDVQMAENANNANEPTTPPPAPTTNTTTTTATTTKTNLKAINEQITQITLTHNQKTENKKDNKNTTTRKNKNSKINT